MRDSKWLRTASVVLACAVLACTTSDSSENLPSVDAGPPAGAETGAKLYVSLCASCHGPDGRGDGPMVPELRTAPADLTLISAKRGGEFPTQEIHAIIDGRRKVRGHGPGNMPVWGRHFERTEAAPDAPSEIIVRGNVAALTEYLKTIQRKTE